MIAIVPAKDFLQAPNLGDVHRVQIVLALPGVSSSQEHDMVNKIANEFEETVEFLDHYCTIGWVRRRVKDDELIYFVSPEAAVRLFRHILAVIAARRAAFD